MAHIQSVKESEITTSELDQEYDRLIGQLVRMLVKPEQWGLKR